jgi:uncharacterized membrane protein
MEALNYIVATLTGMVLSIILNGLVLFLLWNNTAIKDLFGTGEISFATSVAMFVVFRILVGYSKNAQINAK